MNIGFEFIKYSLIAKGRHGIHSPFVYNLIDQVLRKPISEEVKSRQNRLFKALKNDDSIINFEEFGAGSKYLKKQRSVKQIVSTNSTKNKYGNLLFRLMEGYKPMNVLEFGTSIGCGTLQLHWGNPEAQLISIEACKETYEFAKKTMAQHQISNHIQLINSTFNDFLEGEILEKFDLVFIDGHHDGKCLIEYVKKLEKYTHDDTIFILDDIRWSMDMLNAWNVLVNDEQYHLSIDFFKMGLLIRQSNKRKEHFVLRK
jgi:predicted O-methyltransferase YrrM